MFDKRRAQRDARLRHRRLLDAALHLVGYTGEWSASPADVAALAFARHAMEIDQQEAVRYLDAARVQRGRNLPQDQPEPIAAD